MTAPVPAPPSGGCPHDLRPDGGAAGGEQAVAAGITVRRLPEPPSAATPRHWFAGHAFETHFFNALSSTFPEGERFFIQAVRHYAPQVSDPVLQAQVAAFIGQEGQHSREHDAHMDLLCQQGFGGLARANGVLRAVTRWYVRHFPRYSLATTMAIEHHGGSSPSSRTSVSS